MGKLVTVRKEGGSRVLTVTDFIPKEWRYVEVISTTQKNGKVTLTISKVV